MLCRVWMPVLLSFVMAWPLAAEELEYAPADPRLRVERLDTAETESFLAVRADTEGRLFVGGREGLFVYEPTAEGGYAPRQRLLSLPDHSWVYDIEIRGNDLYLLTVSALYIVPEGRVKKEGLAPQRLVWGVPLGHVHQCFHGLALGPEGDVYFAMGDPLWYYGDFTRPDHWGHWTMFSRPSPRDKSDEEWVKTPYTGVGAVFRCRPDGSRLQVVATGLRNSCGLAFDRHWNLFTNDNDHESMPSEYVPGRLNHVTPYAYFGWPRGWMISKTPERMDLLDTMLTTMGRAVPVGQAYYHDDYLPEEYRDNLLVARWCERKLTRYPLQHAGSTFHTEEHDLLIGRNMARPVGISVGRGGRLFATISYMPQNEGSPTYRSDLVMITRADDTAAHTFDAYDITHAEPERLWKELSHPGFDRRQRAQQEILRRGTLVAEAAKRLAAVDPADPALHHLIWLAGAEEGPEALRQLTKLTAHQDPQVRLQALRVLTEYFPKEALTTALKLLKDENLQVQQASVVACLKYSLRHPDQIGKIAPQIAAGPARSKDTYIRQAAVFLLANHPESWDALLSAEDPAGRLAGVLAAGFRLTVPSATAAIPEDKALEKWRTDEAYTIRYSDQPEPIDLRAFGRVGTFTVADHWRTAPRTPDQERTFTLLRDRLSDPDEVVRLQAAHFLYMLNDDRTEETVLKTRTDVQRRRLAAEPIKVIGQVWVAGPFPDGDQGFAAVHPPEKGVVDLSAAYPAGDAKLNWKQQKTARQYNFFQLYGQCDHASFYAYTRLESGSRQPANLLVGSNDGIKVWHNGKLVWTNDVSRGALPIQDVVLLDLQPGGNDILIRVRNVTDECGLFMHYATLQPAEPVLPEPLASGSLADRLKAAASDPEVAKATEKFLTIDWAAALKEGDAERGRKLFGTAGLGCAKCHAVTPDAAGNSGPSLADAVKRFTLPQLVESVLVPNKLVSPVFRATTIATTDGKVYNGLVVGETAEKVELILTDTNRISIPKGDIEERVLKDVSPMPAGLVRTPEELRDLLVYLLSESPAAP